MFLRNMLIYIAFYMMRKYGRYDFSIIMFNICCLCMEYCLYLRADK